MKNILTSFTLFLITGLVIGQTDTENYVQTTTYKKEGVTILEIENNQVPSIDKIEDITYYDGLGRPIQQISAQAGGNGQDIIKYMSYDGYGRQVKEYLPFADAEQTFNNSSLDYRPNILREIETFYKTRYSTEIDTANPNPYTEKILEDSPLGRVLEQGAPGKTWQISDSSSGHTVKFKYQSNKASEVLHFKTIFPNQFETDKHELKYSGHYHRGELYKTITKDENWYPNQKYENDHTTAEFKDVQGNIVLKRTYNKGLQHDTYYVYDKYGNLSYVIPPKASASIIKSDLIPTGIEAIHRPWTSLAAVDSDFAEEYNRRLLEYEDADILNADIENEYGGQGGFSITSNNGTLSVNVTLSTNTPLVLRNGQIASLNELGSFPDMEMGRIEGANFHYVFLIIDNHLYIEGDGELHTINKTFLGENKLEYTKNYSWIDYVKVDEMDRTTYKEQLRSYEDHQILTANIANPYNGIGGFQFHLTTNNELTITLNHTTGSLVELETERPIPLDIERRLPNMELGSIRGAGYEYTFSVLENNLVIQGEGKITGPVNTILNAAYVVNNSIRSEAIEGLCYIYNYDDRNRLIRKNIPGKGWEYIVYDRLDRPIMSQDARQRLDHQWLFTKYDVHNRVVYTGKYVIPEQTIISPNFGDAQDWVREQVENTSHLNEYYTENLGTWTQEDIYYTNRVFPTYDYQNGGDELFTINYYDVYPVGYNNIFPSQITVPTLELTDKTHSLPTVSRIKTLGTHQWSTSVTKYDDKGRALYIAAINETLQSEDYVVNTYDFLGNTTKVETEHSKNGKALTINNIYSYDHIGRATRLKQVINGGAGFNPIIFKNMYDELGQLNVKEIGGKVNYYGTLKEPLQKVNYSYNIRGWLRKINNPNDLSLGQASDMADLFAFEIGYDQPSVFSSTKALYNGNITETSWKTANDNKLRGYYYKYDALNRIVKASNPPINLKPGEFYSSYDLSSVTYDRNGNILNLKRTGQSSIMVQGYNHTDIIDDLTYHYKPYSNQLEKVEDAQLGQVNDQGFIDGASGTDDYSYDLNGNMITDANKQIVSIDYNHLHLPNRIEIESRINNNINYIDYIYDATGVKLEKRVTDYDNEINGDPTNTITQYAGNYIYKQENQLQAMNLKFFSHPEGYVEPKDPSNYTQGFDYVYQYKDHLGNVRLSYSDLDLNGAIDPNTEILSEKNYYPFGLEHKGYNNVVNGTEHKWKYQGKEHEEELGLNTYDFGARNYMSDLGRWTTIDPLADATGQIHNSPYNYALNNPIYFIDPDGNCPPGIDCSGIISALFNGAKDKVNNFLENNDLVFDVKGGVDLKIGAGLEVDSENLDMAADVELLNVELMSFEGDMTDLNNSEIDFVGKDGELEISQKAEFSLTTKDTKFTAVDAKSSFSAYAPDYSATNKTSSTEFFSKTSLTMGSSTGESGGLSRESTHGNTTVSNGTTRTPKASAKLNATNNSSTVSFGVKGGAILNYNFSVNLGFKKKE